MSQEEIKNKLIEEASKKNNVLTVKDVALYYDIDSDQFDTMVELLDNEGIKVLEEDELPEEEPELSDLVSEEEESPVTDEALKAIAIEVTSTNSNDVVKMYFKDIGQFPLLTRDEEIDLAYKIKDGRAAKERLTKIDNEEETVSLEEYEHLLDVEEAGDYAREKLTNSNLRLVANIAKRFTNRGLSFMDLIQEGTKGLLKSIDKYEVEKGFKFSTYATWWIKQAINRAIADQGRTIRLPVHVNEKITKIMQVERELVQELGRDPSIKEIADKIGMTEDKVQFFLNSAREPISLDKPVGEDKESTQEDFIADNSNDTPYEYTERIKLREDLELSMRKYLTDKEERILKLRYGWDDGHPMTLEQIGKIFNITRERIRQIEAKALRKLRSPQKSNRIRGYLNK